MKLKKETRKNLNLKVSESELKQIKKLADKYTNGNLSQWVRYTAINYRPKKSELK